MKIRKAYKYLVFKIRDYKEIVVEVSGGGDYSEFHSKLPANECRFACVDVACEGKTGLASSKLVFLLWAPEGAPVKDRMVYASSKDALTKRLDGIAKVIQACDSSEAELKAVQAHLQ